MMANIEANFPDDVKFILDYSIGICHSFVRPGPLNWELISIQ